MLSGDNVEVLVDFVLSFVCVISTQSRFIFVASLTRTTLPVVTALVERKKIQTVWVKGFKAWKSRLVGRGFRDSNLPSFGLNIWYLLEK